MDRHLYDLKEEGNIFPLFDEEKKKFNSNNLNKNITTLDQAKEELFRLRNIGYESLLLQPPSDTLIEYIQSGKLKNILFY